MKLAGHVECMEQMKNAYTVLTGKHEGKRTLIRPIPPSLLSNG